MDDFSLSLKRVLGSLVACLIYGIDTDLENNKPTAARIRFLQQAGGQKIVGYVDVIC